MGTIASPNLRIPTLSPSALPMALPSVIATSSTMWCWRSPFAFTVTSMRLCVASESSMWSRNLTPVLAVGLAGPVVQPHRTVMSVSFVFLVTLALLFNSPRPPLFFDGINNADGIWFTVSTMTSAPSRSKNDTCRFAVRRRLVDPREEEALEPPVPRVLDHHEVLRRVSHVEQASSRRASGRARMSASGLGFLNLSYSSRSSGIDVGVTDEHGRPPVEVAHQRLPQRVLRPDVGPSRDHRRCARARRSSRCDSSVFLLIRTRSSSMSPFLRGFLAADRRGAS